MLTNQLPKVMQVALHTARIDDWPLQNSNFYQGQGTGDELARVHDPHVRLYGRGPSKSALELEEGDPYTDDSNLFAAELDRDVDLVRSATDPDLRHPNRRFRRHGLHLAGVEARPATQGRLPSHLPCDLGGQAAA